MFHYMFGTGMWFGWIFWIILVAFIVWLIVNRTNTSQNYNAGHHHETPMDILKKRYARGEIDKQEFEEKKKDLMD